MKKILNIYNYQYNYNQLLKKNWSLFVRESRKCSCAIGTSGFCGHIVGLLYSLAHMIFQEVIFYKCFTSVLKIFCEEKKFFYLNNCAKIITIRITLKYLYHRIDVH